MTIFNFDSLGCRKCGKCVHTTTTQGMLCCCPQNTPNYRRKILRKVEEPIPDIILKARSLWPRDCAWRQQFSGISQKTNISFFIKFIYDVQKALHVPEFLFWFLLIFRHSAAPCGHVNLCCLQHPLQQPRWRHRRKRAHHKWSSQFWPYGEASRSASFFQNKHLIIHSLFNWWSLPFLFDL